MARAEAFDGDARLGWLIAAMEPGDASDFSFLFTSMRSLDAASSLSFADKPATESARARAIPSPEVYYRAAAAYILLIYGDATPRIIYTGLPHLAFYFASIILSETIRTL